MVAWNPNTLNGKLHGMMGLQIDLLFLTETRQFKDAESFCARSGWMLKAAPATRTQAGGRSAGVALMHRGAELMQLQLPEHLKKYADEGRLLLARVPAKGQQQPLYAVCVYGYADNPQATVVMIDGIMEHLAQWEDSCCVIGGDLNLQLEDGWLDALLGQAGWHDGVLAGATDGQAQPTCFSGNEHSH